MAKKKYTLDMNEALMDRVVAYAEEQSISRNAAISILVTQALDARKAMGTLDELMQAYKIEAAKQALEQAAGQASEPMG